jgi:hypothetical protein
LAKAQKYSTQAIAPAPFQDGARAVQFLRTKSKEWNIDSKRFAATGGSAGAGISLWLGFHMDMADPKSDDPLLRQSTRMTCMFVTEGQTSYDPRFIRKLFPGKDIYRIGALQKLFDFNLSELDALPAEKYRLFEECSPITHVTKDAPPVLLLYNNPIDAEIRNQGIGIHHPPVRQGAQGKNGRPQDTVRGCRGRQMVGSPKVGPAVMLVSLA